eukprot:1152973-Pelagomonas_calceolata.AAC.2
MEERASLTKSVLTSWFSSNPRISRSIDGIYWSKLGHAHQTRFDDPIIWVAGVDNCLRLRGTFIGHHTSSVTSVNSNQSVAKVVHRRSKLQLVNHLIGHHDGNPYGLKG